MYTILNCSPKKLRPAHLSKLLRLLKVPTSDAGVLDFKVVGLPNYGIKPKHIADMAELERANCIVLDNDPARFPEVTTESLMDILKDVDRCPTTMVVVWYNDRYKVWCGGYRTTRAFSVTRKDVLWVNFDDVVTEAMFSEILSHASGGEIIRKGSSMIGADCPVTDAFLNNISMNSELSLDAFAAANSILETAKNKKVRNIVAKVSPSVLLALKDITRVHEDYSLIVPVYQLPSSGKTPSFHHFEFF